MICNLYLSSLHFSFVPHLLFYKNHKVITDLTWLWSQFKNIMTLFDIHAVKSLLFRLFILHSLVKKNKFQTKIINDYFKQFKLEVYILKVAQIPGISWILYFIWIVHPMARPVIFFLEKQYSFFRTWWSRIQYRATIKIIIRQRQLKLYQTINGKYTYNSLLE